MQGSSQFRLLAYHAASHTTMSSDTVHSLAQAPRILPFSTFAPPPGKDAE